MAQDAPSQGTFVPHSLHRATIVARVFLAGVGVPRTQRRLELSALAQALEALASPLEWPTREAWVLECLRRVRALLGADAAIMFGPLVGEPGVLSPDLPANILSSFKALYSSEGGAIHSSDQGMDHFFATQRCGPSLLTFSDVRQMVGPRLEDGALYQTVIAPSGLLGSASIGVVIGGCQTVLSVQAARESDLALDPDERDERARMRLLQPALVVGLETLRRLDTWRSVLVAMLDRSERAWWCSGRTGFTRLRAMSALTRCSKRSLKRHACWTWSGGRRA